MADKVRWERKTAGRIGMAHVFDDGGISLCKSARRTEDFKPDKSKRWCAGCRRIVDPAGAPKAPSWRRSVP